MKVPWQEELLKYVNDDFENEVLKITMEELNPDRILQRVKELIREKLHEDKKPEN